MLRGLLLSALVLPGCSGLRLTSPAEPIGTPIARGLNGGSASFALTTCAPSSERARLVEEIVLQLNQQGAVAVADGAGSQSRVILNLCGSGGQVPQSTPARPVR